MQSLLKFFPKKEIAAQDAVALEVQHFASAAVGLKALLVKDTQRKRGSTPWAKWPPHKKQALAEELAGGLSWTAFKV